MQQYLVPQFIEVEDKIIGPITTRQFIQMLISILLAFLLYKTLAFIYFILGAVLDIGLFSVLAFARVNGRPIHFFILNFIQTSKRPKLRVWNRESFIRNVQYIPSGAGLKTESYAKKEPVSGSRLRDLTLVINTGGVYESED
ncbi:MAG: hypothetical protein UT32_C0012G0008 [Parcubacteria group bacterium GW2011_GWC2_39_14]|nr:MAG: hypothetical protein UT32_C0012G0008 [Parcubacteria group bacterium GW2011_GWC2_39_14]KKR55179.1 MAG: hypothetical protein UT91_C0004G0078 [Parcubacteria group bacterium GW2011_GWA2_40_23]